MMSTDYVTKRPRSVVQLFAVLLAFGLCITAAVLGGVWIGQTRSPNPPFPYPQVQASTAASGTVMAVATGQISDNAEGIFFLDFLTGDLQCLVYYPRIGVFGARYYTNVQQQLPSVGRNAQYLLVTGMAVSTGSTGGARPGGSLVYVTDVTTGMFASYAVPWDRSAESSGRLQTGPLVFAGGGPIRNFVLREAATAQPASVEPKKK